jgi:signal transduction histidine kinase
MPDFVEILNRLDRWNARRATVLLAGMAGVAMVGSLDWAIKSVISVSSLYLLPVCFVAWFSGTRAGLLTTGIAAMVWLTVQLLDEAAYYDWPGVLWQGLSRLLFLAASAIFVSRIRYFKMRLERLVRERTAALEAAVIHSKALERESAEIADREQERVAHELHDQLAAYLSGIAFRVKTLAESLDRNAAVEAPDARNLVGLVNCASDQVRNLSRLLAPVEGTQNDLELALSRLAAEFESVFRITCILQIASPLPTLATGQVHQLYRITQEAVRNAIQHARADLVNITVRRTEDRLQLVISCQGEAWKHPATSSDGLGLRIMRHRTDRLGGRLTINHTEDGRTLVTCEVPIDDPRQVQPEPHVLPKAICL